MNNVLETVGAVHTHTHTHTIHFLNKGESVAPGSASFEVDVCNVTAASVCFVILIDYS